MPSVHSSQPHRQTVISHHQHFLAVCESAVNCKYNEFYERWTLARADNQREATWKQREFTGGDEAGVACDGTGSPYTALVPRV